MSASNKLRALLVRRKCGRGTGCEAAAGSGTERADTQMQGGEELGLWPVFPTKRGGRASNDLRRAGRRPPGSQPEGRVGFRVASVP